jgi:tight adherence protein C
MMLVMVVGALAGLGVLAVVHGLTSAPPSLETIEAVLRRPVEWGHRPELAGGPSERLGGWVVSRFQKSGLPLHHQWSAVTSSLEVAGESADQLASKAVLAGAAGLLGPPLLAALSRPIGFAVPLYIAVVCGLMAFPLCAGAPFVGLARRAKERRRHFRGVVASFVDLVVLGLAGGVGIEGALLAASQVSSDWASQRMGRVLLRARDSGESPWNALGRLGQELGVPELAELSATLQLAGTEGARIRHSLSARAVSLRRHEQAEAESSANAMTERLFLPGALLLVGFLLFVGYPAFSRILGGW